MLDYDPELIGGALDDFRTAEALAPQGPDGVAAVRATVARRRRVKVTTFSLVGALLVAVPIAAFAAHPRGNNPPPEVLESATPNPARWGLFDSRQLSAARVAVPADVAWEGCPTQVTSDGPKDTAPSVFVGDAIYPNLDDDPALETAVIVVCQLQDRMVTQVVGYDIDAAGAPVSMGALVKPLSPHTISSITRRDGDGVIVTVAFSPFDHLDDAEPQTREFAWDGTAFRQVAGPTAFPERVPGDLSVTAGPLTFNPLVNGMRRGNFAITVKNKGTVPTPFVRISVPIRGLMIAGVPQSGTVRFPGLQPGETKVFELDVMVSAKDDDNRATMKVGAYSYIHDATPGDNQVEVAINRL